MKYLQPADSMLLAGMLLLACAIAKTAQHRIKHRIKPAVANTQFSFLGQDIWSKF